MKNINHVSNLYPTPTSYNQSGGGSGPISDSVAFSDLLVALKAADTTGVIWGGPDMGLGNTYVEIYSPNINADVNNLAYYCSQSSGAGQIQMSIYDENFQKIGDTGLVVPIVGVTFVPLLAATPIVKEGIYYRALACNENAASFVGQSSKYAGAGPSLAFNIPNLMCPADISAYESNKTSNRYFIGGN